MILQKLFLQAEPLEIGDGLGIGIGIFSIILFALAITAYRNTGMKKILFAAAAFGLFSIQLIFDSLDEYIPFVPESAIDILVPLITLVILILFFVAIVKKR